MMFLALASLEDARIKGGGGMIDREEISEQSSAEGMSVQDYFEMKRQQEELCRQIRESQAPLRAKLEGRVRQMIEESWRW